MDRLCEHTVALVAVKKKDPEEPSDHVLGRSRRGFSTKIHILCDANGHPLHFHLTPGLAHESTALDILFLGADTCLLDGEGKSVACSVALGGDQEYRPFGLTNMFLISGSNP